MNNENFDIAPNDENEEFTVEFGEIFNDGGTSDYEDLDNLPKVNNVTLTGNKSLSDLGIQPAGDYALESEIPDVSNFITKSVDDLVNYYKKSETFTKQEVNNLISAITTLDIRVVQTLPTEDISTTTIYLVPKATAGTNDAYDEYIYVSNAWEHIGSTEVDLTNYVTNTDYATSSSAGVIRVGSSYGVSATTSGNLFSPTKTYAAYSDAGDYMFIGKGTLENVITGKGLGTYSKPSGGIPATDLTTSVQTTLTKADNQVWYGTQAQYDALSQINPDTLYCIVES